MPIKLTDLVAGKRSIVIDFGGDDQLHITYDPAQITAENEREEAQLRMRGLRINAIALSLSRMIVEWDLVDDKSKPLPIEMETLEKLGYDVVSFIMRSINEDFHPNVLTAGRSGGTSSANGKAPAQVAD